MYIPQKDIRLEELYILKQNFQFNSVFTNLFRMSESVFKETSPLKISTKLTVSLDFVLQFKYHEILKQ